MMRLMRLNWHVLAAALAGSLLWAGVVAGFIELYFRVIRP